MYFASMLETNRTILLILLDYMTLLFFQETKLTKTAVQFLKLKVGNQYFIEASCTDSARRGVVTIIKSSIISQIVRTESVEEVNM